MRLRKTATPRHPALVLFVFAFGSIVCQAQHMNAADAPCRKPMSGAEETECFVAASKLQDKKLNELYQQALKVVESDDITQLQKAQRVWLRFRDATCSAEKALYQGGSAQPMVYYACLEAETRYRVKDLEDTYEWRIEKFR